MIVGSVCACSGCRGVAVLTFLGMSRQLPVTTARHPASGATPNFCQSPLFFCAQRLDHFTQHGINVLIPSAEDRQIAHRIIYQELCLGEIRADSKAEYLRIIGTLAHQGAEAVVLACTEIGLLLNQSDTQIKLFDTTAIHAQKAVEYAIA